MGEVDERLVCRVCQKVSVTKSVEVPAVLDDDMQRLLAGSKATQRAPNVSTRVQCVFVSVGCHDSDPSVADIIDEIDHLHNFCPG